MIHYLKYRIWDWLLCVAISVGLVFHIYSGFILEDSLSSNTFAIIVVMAVLMAIFLLFAYNRTMTIIGIVAGVCALIGFLISIRSNNIFEQETANSLAITITITIITALLVFLACRTKVGIIVLFLIGTIVMAGSYFLQYPIQIWNFWLFVFAMVVMLWYRNYTIALRKVHTGKVHMHRYLEQSIIICLMVVLMAGGIYIGIIKPINPPTRELQLIIRLEDMELLQVMGMTTPKEMLDPNMQSSQDPNSSENTSDEGEEENQEDGAEPESESAGESQEDSETENPTSAEQTQAIHYTLDETVIPWLAIFLVLLILLAIVLKILLKKNWEKKVAALSPENQVVNYYQFFLKRLALAGYTKPENHTLSEYAANMEHELSEFADEENSFVQLTQIYAATFYGRQTVSKEEAAQFEQFYKGFNKHLRKEMGGMRYFCRVVLHLRRKKKKG